MKVLYINTVFCTGSTGRIVKDLGEEVKKNGGDYVAAYGRGISDDPHAYHIGEKAGVYTHALLSRMTDRSGFYSRYATKKLIEKIRDYNPDVIHLHNIHGYYLNIEILFSFLRNEFKGKVIWTLHDCWAFTGHCTHYTFVNCRRWQTACQNCPQKNQYPASILIDNSKENFIKKKKAFSGIPNLTLVTPSQWLCDEVKKSFLSEYPCLVINNGIDLDTFHPVEKGKAENVPILLNVADGIDKKKGHEDLVALKKILPENYRIIVVGAKNGERLGQGIECIPRTNSLQELVNYYNMADLFINPTYEDNFPTVNLESLACGTPVITYKTGGSAECLAEGCGKAVPTGSIIQLAHTVLHSSFSREKCVDRAKYYNKHEKYAEYLALYGGD